MSQENLSLFWNKLAFRSLNVNSPDLPFQMLERVQRIETKDLIMEANKRRNELLHSTSVVFDEVMRLKGRLLVGVGNASIIEVGMTFSRNYGFPIIPSSSLKGCFSMYLREIAGYDKKKIKDLFGEDVSGDDHIQGRLVFLDAIPVENVTFSLDIVNNHFVPYYSRESPPPNDWYNPVPVVYIVVKGGRFRFTLIEQGGLSEDEKKELKEHFVEMLRYHGLGAKTNYGYGRFEP
ncbi:type III-B CRISPR module RAMP protein Cmr6 [Pseudothermotoga sp.]